MSNVYSTEPQTTANVVFETTHGPLNIHLWAKECPYTTRYFLQLCLDGYYDNLPFSRIIAGFMIQTGDSLFRQPSPQSQPPSSTSLGDGTGPPPLDPSYLLPPQDDYRRCHAAGEALERRKYELNNRIRFNHRGQLAMAMNINDDPEDASAIKLQPQFFITLEDAPHLDGQHVLFGTVVGASIFNAIRIGQTADVDETTNQPTSIEEAPRILRTKVQSIDGLPETLPALVQTPEPPLLPWHIDPYPQSSEGDGRTGGGKQKNKKKARKGVKNINLLSFGEEMEGEEDGDNDEIARKPKASKPSSKKEKKDRSDKEKKKDKNKVKDKPEMIQTPLENEESSDKLDNTDEEQGRRSTMEEDAVLNQEEESKMGRQSQQKYSSSDMHQQEEPTKVEYQPTKKKEEHQSASEQESSKSMDSKSKSSDVSSHRHAKKEKKTKQKKISLVELRRAKYARYQKNNSTAQDNKQSKEEDTMKKLMAFRQKVASVTSDDHLDEKKKRKKNRKRKRTNEDGGDDDDDNDDDGHYYGQVTEDYTYDSKKDDDWMKAHFKCRRHMDHDARSRNMMAGSDGRSATDYKVVEDKNIATDRKQDRRKNHHQR